MVQPRTEDVKAIQTALKDRGMYNGPLDGAWNADLNHGLNQYLWEQQQAGKDAGTYSLKVDQIYGRETKKSMEAAMKAGNPFAPSTALFTALNNMYESGALRAVYQKEDLNIDSGPVTVTATPDKIEPVSTPVATQLMQPSGTAAVEQFAQPAPAGAPSAGAQGPAQPQVRLPPGAVDLTGLVRSNDYGAGNPVTLYDWQGNRSTVALGPEALSGVVQLSRDPQIPNNIMLTVSDRAGQNATSYSMSASDAARTLAGYGTPAAPLGQQVQDINREIVRDQLNATRRANSYHVPPEYVQPNPAPNWDGRFANVQYRNHLPPEPIRDFPNAPQMGAAFALEARGAGPYAMMMAQREAIMMNGGGYDPRDRGVSVNIGLRIGQ